MITMTYFSFLPLVKIDGKTEFNVDSKIVDKIIVNSKEVKFKLNKSQNTKEITMIDFSNKKGFNGIHTFYGSEKIAEYPLELMFSASIDILEDISTQFGVSTLVYNEENLPKEHLIEILYALNDKIYLPFQVRRPSTKTLFSNVFTLTPVTGTLMYPIEMLSDKYEDFIENALLTFIYNVSEPLKWNANPDIKQFIKRLDDLASIITGQIDNIRDRSFQYSRIIVPLIHFANIKKQISKSISIDSISKNTVSYSFNYPVEIKAEDLAYFLSNMIIE